MIKIYDYKTMSDSDIFSREITATGVEQIVSDIIATVRSSGDSALYAYTEKFDGVALSSLEVTKEEIDKAFKSVDPEFIKIIKRSAANIKAFHKKQIRRGFKLKNPTVSFSVRR